MRKMFVLVAFIAIDMLLFTTHVVRATPLSAQSSLDNAIHFAFARPIAIPGQVLAAGNYEFQVVESLGNRDIVQIASANHSKVYGRLLVIPEKRMTTSGPATVTFKVSADRSPEAIRAIFYADRLWGYGLVYPEAQAKVLAASNHVAVPATPSRSTSASTVSARIALQPSVTSLANTRLIAIDPNGREVDVTQAVLLRNRGTGSAN